MSEKTSEIEKLAQMQADLNANKASATCVDSTVTRSHTTKESASDKFRYTKIMEGIEDLTGAKRTRKIFENLHAINLHDFYLNLIRDYLIAKNVYTPGIGEKRFDRFCKDTENGTKLIAKNGDKKPFNLVSDSFCSQIIAAWSEFDKETRKEMRKGEEQIIKEMEERREKEQRIKDIREKIDMYTAAKMNKEQILTVLSSFGYTYEEIGKALQK